MHELLVGNQEITISRNVLPCLIVLPTILPIPLELPSSSKESLLALVLSFSVSVCVKAESFSVSVCVKAETVSSLP